MYKFVNKNYDFYLFDYFYFKRSEENVSETPNLRLWLQKRNITCGFFCTLIKGEVPPKPIPDASNSIDGGVPKIEKNPFAKVNSSPVKYNSSTACPMVVTVNEAAPQVPREPMVLSERLPLNASVPRKPNVVVPREPMVVSEAGPPPPTPSNLVIPREPMVISEGPPNVPREIVIETLAQTDALIRRIMKCTSPDDPQLKDVINSEEDLQLANFLSKSLNSAIFHFHEKSNSNSADKKDHNTLRRHPPHEAKQSTLFPIGHPIVHPRGHNQPTFQEEPRLPILRQTSTNQYGGGGGDDDDGPNPENSMLLSATAAAAPTNYQNRGLCGLREPLLNYQQQQQDQFRQRRRSGDQFRNEIPIKRKFHLHQNQELRYQQW